MYSELFRADTEIVKFTFISFHQAYTVNEKVTWKETAKYTTFDMVLWKKSQNLTNTLVCFSLQWFIFKVGRWAKLEGDCALCLTRLRNQMILFSTVVSGYSVTRLDTVKHMNLPTVV